MSDGPHRSLPMRNGWRKLAERAANTNFEPTEISEAIPVAIKDDWDAEGCDQTVRELRNILEDNRQGSLFGQEQEDRIDALKDVSAAGFPLRRMLIESITQAAEDGEDAANAVQAGVARAVAGLMTKVLGAGLVRVRLGTKSFDKPRDLNGRAMPFTTVPYEVSKGDFSFPETSARSRGFKFALLSGVAAYLANVRRVIVPESGQGALGPSLVTVGQSHDDFRNHPAFTNKVSQFLKALLGVSIEYEFPRLWYTKGQTLRAYVALPSSGDWKATRSCWQDNRHASVDGKRRQCGICAACMLRRLSVHAAGLEEDKETYVWDDLTANTFEAAAPSTLMRIEKVQKEYALAGTLHLDHLAWLKQSPLGEHVLATNASRLEKPLKISNSEARANLDNLLSQHRREWKSFVNSLGPTSFIRNWAE